MYWGEGFLIHCRIPIQQHPGPLPTRLSPIGTPHRQVWVPITPVITMASRHCQMSSWGTKLPLLESHQSILLMPSNHRPLSQASYGYFKESWAYKRSSNTFSIYMTSLVAQMVKSLPAMQETQVQSLGWEDPPEKEMATHSSILTWEIPQTEEAGGLPSMEL